MPNTAKQRFIVEEANGIYKVYDTVKLVYITKDCPKDVAYEIAEDFEKMTKGDMTPLFKINE